MGKGANLGVSLYNPISSAEPPLETTMGAPDVVSESSDELERGLLPAAPESSSPAGYLETVWAAADAAMTAVKERLQLSPPPSVHKEGYEAPQGRMRKAMRCQCVKMVLAALVGAFIVITAGHLFHGPPPPGPWGPWGMESDAPPPSGILGWLLKVKDFFFGHGGPNLDPMINWAFLLDSGLCEPGCGPPHGPPHHHHHHGPPHHHHPHGPPHGPPGPPFGPHPPFPPPPPFARELVENTTRLVGESVEEFFGEKLPEAKTCNESLSAGVAAIVKSATDKAAAFAEEPTTSKIRQAFANFTRDFPRLAGLSVIADADVSPLQLAYLRSLVSGACYNDSSKALLKLHAIEGAVDRFLLPAVFRALLPPPPPFGPHPGPPHHPPHRPPHGPPGDDDDGDDVSDDVMRDPSEVEELAEPDSWIDPRWLEQGPTGGENRGCHPRPPHIDPEVLKECIATNLELARAVVKKEVFRLCNGPKPPPVRRIVDKVCEFTEENKDLVRTTVLLRLQPWKIAIGACLPPFPPPPPFGPHGPPHGDEPPFEPPHGGPRDPMDALSESGTKVYAFPDVFEGTNVGAAITP